MVATPSVVRCWAALAAAACFCAQASAAARVHIRPQPSALARRPSLPSACVSMAEVDETRWPEIVKAYVTSKFSAIDLDRSGEVDREELGSLYRSMMPKASDEDIEGYIAAFFAKFDADDSGDIDEGEFRQAVLSNQLLNSDMRLKEQVYMDVLNTFKASGDKLITAKALSSLEAQLDWEGSNLPLEYMAIMQAFLKQ